MEEVGINYQPFPVLCYVQQCILDGFISWSRSVLWT